MSLTDFNNIEPPSFDNINWNKFIFLPILNKLYYIPTNKINNKNIKYSNQFGG